MFTYTIQTPERLNDPLQFSEIIIKANEDGSSKTKRCWEVILN